MFYNYVCVGVLFVIFRLVCVRLYVFQSEKRRQER